MTLYDVLGIMPDCYGEDELKAAYKAAAKRTHPDAGGSDEEFQAVAFAYEVLSDPERREKYDRDGTAEETQADQGRRAAFKIINELLAGLIQEVVGSDKEPVFNGDVMKTMRGLIAHRINEGTQKRNKLATGIVRLSALAERFTVTEGKDNILAKMIDSHIPGMQRMIEEHEKEIALNREVDEILKDAKFRWDQPTQTYYATGLGTTTTMFPFAQAR